MAGFKGGLLDAGLKEMIRVTKPGGRILLVVPDSGKNDDPGWSAMELWLEVRFSHKQAMVYGTH